jgi:ribosomal protein S12 methylthiotransferase accessory factor
MQQEFKITFEGELKVRADTGKFLIDTDQDPKSGGEGSAPEPFTLFLASIGACAGAYALSFCKHHNIRTDGIYLRQIMHYDEQKKGLSKIEIILHIPDSVPERYREALRRSADLCAVKRVILQPPEFEVKLG